MDKIWLGRRPDRTRIYTINFLLAASLQFSGTTGCTNAILTAGAAAVTASQEERGLTTAAKDLAIQANINALFLKQELYSWPAITVSVFDGRVLLTGAVTQQAARLKAEKIAKRGRGVRRVFNEIQVTKTERNWIKDQITTLTLKDKLLRDKSIFSINYSVNVVNGVVYLMGIAQTSAELERVRAHSRNTKSLLRIVDYVIVKN